MVQCAKMKQIQKFNISLRELDIFVSNYKTFQTFFFITCALFHVGVSLLALRKFFHES